MPILDKLGSFAKSAADKTNDMIETNKLNSKINEHKGKITSLKAQIAEYYWAKYEQGEELDAQAKEFCAGIRDQNEAIEALTLEIQKIKAVPAAQQVSAPVAGGIPCAACGAAIEPGKKFCASCGSPAPVIEPVPEPSVIRCVSCGEEIEAGKKFCANCGAAV